MKKLALALLVFCLGCALVELGHRAWLAARGKPYDSALFVRELREAAKVEQAQDASPSRDDLVAILHPYFGSEIVHDTGGVLEYYRDEPASKRIEILILGGSVAFNFAEELRDTVRRELESDPRLAGREVVLLNYAHPTYKQPQQLDKLAYLLCRGHRPEVVIEIDGFNETALALDNFEQDSDPLFPDYSSWGVLAAQQGLGAADFERIAQAVELRERARGVATAMEAWHLSISSLLARWAAARVNALNGRIDALEHAQSRSDEVVRGSDRWRQIHGPDGPPTRRAAAALCLDAWREGSISLDALCRARGILYFHVLQPTLWDVGSKPLAARERQLFAEDNAWAVTIKDLYPLLRKEGAKLIERRIAFIDASQAFVAVDEELYRDHCHFNERGNQILWQRIAARVIEGLVELPAASTPR